MNSYKLLLFDLDEDFEDDFVDLTAVPFLTDSIHFDEPRCSRVYFEKEPLAF